MRPSRTREERKNPIIYIPEEELKYQLEQQAAEKRKLKLVEAIKEKEQILDHYENYKMPAAKDTSELEQLIAQKRAELERLNQEIEMQDPEFFESIKQYEQKLQQQREPKKKEVQEPIFQDFFFSKQDGNQGEGKILTKGELEREKRLRLREQERMRRLAGILDSVYEGTESGKTIAEKPSVNEKQGLDLPINNKNQLAPFYNDNKLANNYQFQKEEKSSGYLPSISPEKEAQKDYLYGNSIPDKFPQKEAPITSDSRNYSGYNPYGSSPQQRAETPQRLDTIERRSRPGTNTTETLDSQDRNTPVANDRSKPNTAQQQRSQTTGDLFSKLGQNEVSAQEKKRRYKEELDELVKQKQAAKGLSRESHSRGSLPPLHHDKENNKFVNQEPLPLDWERKQKMADEVMKEINAKERAERRSSHSISYAHNYADEHESTKRNIRDYDTLPPHKQVHPENPQQEDYFFRNRNEQPVYHAQTTHAYRGTIHSGGVDRSLELEKKKKYKEELDAMVEEKKRLQSAKGRRSETPLDLPPSHQTTKEQYNNFFLNKVEQEEEERKRAIALQKQKHAEELRKQMEEKEEQRRREKLKRQEEEMREAERLRREAELEKQRMEQEALKHQELERKRTEHNLQTIQQHQQKAETQNPPFHPTNVLPQERPTQKTEFVEDHRYIHPEPRSTTLSENPSTHSLMTNPQQSQMPMHQPVYQQPDMNRPSYHYQGNPPMQNPQMMYPPYQQGYMPQYYQPMGYPPSQMDLFSMMQPLGIPASLYHDMNMHRALVQELIQEKMRIEKVALEERVLIEEYKNKIKEMKLEQYQFEKEIEKLKNLLENPSSVDVNSIKNNPHLLALQELQTQRAQRIDNYNKLVMQSQQSLVNVIKSYNDLLTRNPQVSTGFVDSPQKLKINYELNTSLDQSTDVRASLPSSNLLQNVAPNELEKSFMKDLEAFKEMHKQHFNIDPNNPPQDLNTNQNAPIEKTVISHPGNFSHIIPNYLQMESQINNTNILNQQSDILNFSNSIPGTALKTKESNRQYDNMFDPSSVRMNLISPMDQHRTMVGRETNPLMFDKSPEVNYKDNTTMSVSRDASNPTTKRDLKNNYQVKELIVRESPEFERKHHDHTGSFAPGILDQIKDTMIKPSETSTKKAFDLPLQNTTTKYSTLKTEAKESVFDTDMKKPVSDVQTPTAEKMDPKLTEVEKLEIKMEEVPLERSLILADESEEADNKEIEDFIKSDDHSFQDIKASLDKETPAKAQKTFDPLKVTKLSENSDNKKLEGIAEKVLPRPSSSNSSLSSIKKVIEERNRLRMEKSTISEPTHLPEIKSSDKKEIPVRMKSPKQSPIKKATPTKESTKEPLKEPIKESTKEPEVKEKKLPSPIQVPTSRNELEEPQEPQMILDNNSAMRTSQMSYHSGQEKKFKTPKIIDPFARINVNDSKSSIITAERKSEYGSQRDFSLLAGKVPDIFKSSKQNGEINIVGQSQNYVSSRPEYLSDFRSPNKIVDPYETAQKSEPLREVPVNNLYGLPRQSEELASTVDMNDYDADEAQKDMAALTDDIPKSQDSVQRFIQQQEKKLQEIDEFLPKHEDISDELNRLDNQRRSKMILERLQRLLEGISDRFEDTDTVSNRIKEVDDEGDEDRLTASRDSLFKPFNRRTYSNRYLTNEDM